MQVLNDDDDVKWCRDYNGLSISKMHSGWSALTHDGGGGNTKSLSFSLSSPLTLTYFLSFHAVCVCLIDKSIALIGSWREPKKKTDENDRINGELNWLCNINDPNRWWM